jgi:hypothetical protein
LVRTASHPHRRQPADDLVAAPLCNPEDTSRKFNRPQPRVATLALNQLSAAHTQRFADRLARMHGAAMKMGQLMSLDGSDLLTPEAAAIMASLCDRAQPMPLGQINQVGNAASEFAAAPHRGQRPLPQILSCSGVPDEPAWPLAATQGRGHP